MLNPPSYFIHHIRGWGCRSEGAVAPALQSYKYNFTVTPMDPELWPYGRL